MAYASSSFKSSALNYNELLKADPVNSYGTLMKNISMCFCRFIEYKFDQISKVDL